MRPGLERLHQLRDLSLARGAPAGSRPSPLCFPDFASGTRVDDRKSLIQARARAAARAVITGMRTGLAALERRLERSDTIGDGARPEIALCIERLGAFLPDDTVEVFRDELREAQTHSKPRFDRRGHAECS